MAIGNTAEMIEERRQLRDGETELSERAFNLTIGAVLLWGFLLNYLMVTLFGAQISRMAAEIGTMAFVIGYLALALTGTVMIGRGGAAVSFLGYNLMALPIGAVICVCVDGIPMDVVRSAVLVTAIVTLSFMILATVFPGFFLGMGRTLAAALLASMVTELIGLLVFHRHSPIYEWVFVGVFSLYVGYDWSRANTCARTLDNAVDLAAALYLDIINLFLRILEIMSRNKDD